MRAFALAVGLALAGAAHAQVAAVDDEGRTVELARPAGRIVSLAPHLTEQLFAIGAGDLIVGTTDFADYPEAARALPRVARAHSVDLERVSAARPDLVLVWGSGFPPATIEAVRRLGVPTFVSEPARLEDIATSLERLGVLTGRTSSRAAAEFSAKLAALRDRYRGRREVRVFYQVWSDPLMTLGGRHLVSEGIALCGGRNVFADLAPMAPRVSTEAVLAADPEVIVTAEPGGHPSGALESWKRFARVTAVRRDLLFTLDADRINRNGPRIVDEIAALCEAIDRAR
ncbi:MAG: cobalamin-binding protein [Betaproteobacteria bacterium]